jgi:hypothetical protein
VLIRRLDQHEIGKNADSSVVRVPDKPAEFFERAVPGVDRERVCDVEPVRSSTGWKQWRQHHGVHTEPLQVVELLDDSADIPDAIEVRVEETRDVKVVNERFAPPAGIGSKRVEVHLSLGSQPPLR